jgi:hypothetical protein
VTYLPIVVKKQPLLSILPPIFNANIAFGSLGYNFAPLQQCDI